MFLRSILLSNFRNFKKRSIDFSSLITVFVGPNTIGKTSILEAIYYLATGKSFRAEKDGETVRWGESIGRIIGEIFQMGKIEDKEKLEVVFAEAHQFNALVNQRKKFTVNGVSRRMIDFVGNLKAVLFWPEDLDLVTDSPSLRRRYLDFVLMQVDREYRRSIISYEKGVRQRNRLLERIRDEAVFAYATTSQGKFRNQLMFWDQLLIKSGNYITEKREEYIALVNASEKKLGSFKLFYDASKISPLRLEQYKEEEIASATTLVGPHRDDFKFIFKNDKDMSIYGSRGEQRLAVLWLKLCELSFIENKTQERPILLLDDIFSELDLEHRDLVFEIIDKQQTIITTLDLHFIKNEKRKKMEIMNI